MNLLGLQITRTRTKAAVAPITLSDWNAGWLSVIRESFTGAWQRNVEIDRTEVLAYATVWACMTLIAADIAKLWIKLIERTSDGIWTETENPAYSSVIRRPNHYQTRIKFIEYWILSKLQHGNTYVLLERNHRGGENQGNVAAMYVLDPTRVKVLVAPDGSVFYQIAADYLAGIDETNITVPASEIIHDIMVPLHHPLVGVSPLYACGLAAMHGLKIQNSQAKLFANGSQPGGVLTAPGMISDVVAARIQKHWTDNFAGEANIGKVAVLGDGLKYEPMMMSAVNAQLIDQLRWSELDICKAFHVPPFMLGIGAPPPYTDIQSMTLQYYTLALQNPIENLELLLDQGLGLPSSLGIELDIDGLARMDTKTQMEVAVAGVKGTVLTPNEARRRFDKKPLKGGDTVYLQQQDYSIEAINRRDQSAPAPASGTPATQPALPPAPTEAKDTEPTVPYGYFAAAMMQKFAAVEWSEIADAA